MTTFSEIQRAFWEEHTNLRPYHHPVVQAFAKQRIGLVKELIRSGGVSSALDVGCGDGFGTYFMQQLVPHLVGCDRSLTMPHRNPVDKKSLCLADAYALPFADASFNLVYCWELLHVAFRHLEKDALQVAARRYFECGAGPGASPQVRVSSRRLCS